jgi:hypothetical protein
MGVPLSGSPGCASTGLSVGPAVPKGLVREAEVAVSWVVEDLTPVMCMGTSCAQRSVSTPCLPPAHGGQRQGFGQSLTTQSPSSHQRARGIDGRVPIPLLCASPLGGPGPSSKNLPARTNPRAPSLASAPASSNTSQPPPSSSPADVGVTGRRAGLPHAVLRPQWPIAPTPWVSEWAGSGARGGAQGCFPLRISAPDVRGGSPGHSRRPVLAGCPW